VIKIDWEKLKSIHQHLVDSQIIEPDMDVIFAMVLSDGTVKRSAIKFKDFLSFFWSISEKPQFDIVALVAQDKEGRILYRHRQLRGNEEIPTGGNANVIIHWDALTPEEKETYIRLMVSQINAYER